MHSCPLSHKYEQLVFYHVCYVSREVHIETMHIITKHVKEVVKTLIVELHPHFLSHGVMEGIVVILPQSWLMAKYCDQSFKWHMNIIKVQHYYLKMTKSSKVCVP